MPFINEYISPEDIIKYNIEGINRNTTLHQPAAPAGIPIHVNAARDWTIDRERDIYLRQVTTNQGRPDMGMSNDGWEGWTLYWKGELVWFAQQLLSTTGVRKGPRHNDYLITHLTLANHLEAERLLIQSIIEEAFLAYAGGGVYSTSTAFTATFTFAD